MYSFFKNVHTVRQDKQPSEEPMKRMITLLCALCLLLFCLQPAAAADETPPLAQVQSLTSTLSDDTTVTLQWAEVPDATGYKVYCFNEEADKFKTVLTTTATLGVVPQLQRGKTYRFRVRAFQKTETGNRWGDNSEECYAVTAPYALKNLRVRDVTTDTVTLQWKAASGATHYEIYLYDKEKKEFRLYGLSGHNQMTVRRLDANRTYRFKVRPFRLEKGKYAPGPLSDAIRETTDTNGLPHTAWQAVKAYSRALNAAKGSASYQLAAKKTVKMENYKVSRAAFSGTVDNLMRLFSGTRKKSYTVKNGKTADGLTALSLLPPANKTLTLTPADIKTYTAEKQKGGGYKLTLTLKEDVSLFENGKTSKPATLAKATYYPRFEKLDTTPIKLQSGKVLYDAATLVLTVDKQHLLQSLSTSVRAAMRLGCTAASVSFDAAIVYTCAEQYVLRR